MTKKEILEWARKLEKSYNPYKVKAIKYHVGSEQRYVYANELMSESEIEKAYIDTAAKDIKKGFEERMVGYYDKWYRYSRADEGRAYDVGQNQATFDWRCPVEFHIIECEG